jgi:hypothetical protein
VIPREAAAFGVRLHLDVVLELGVVTHIRRSPLWPAPRKMPLDGRQCTSVVRVFPCFWIPVVLRVGAFSPATKIRSRHTRAGATPNRRWMTRSSRPLRLLS